MTTVLISGSAGFIGYHLTILLINCGYRVVAIDNLRDSPHSTLKYARLSALGIGEEEAKHQELTSGQRLNFVQLDLRDKNDLFALFNANNIDLVINLAAKTGVRNSLTDPQSYIDNNIMGFSNLLECCKEFAVKKLLFASSSSVYGKNEQTPFAEEHDTSHPISTYALTKKTNELMAYNYARLYGISTVGLRFFTVYGPWNRTDMAIFLFIKAIYEGTPIKLFNGGNMYRDFTYVGDVVEAIKRTLNLLEGNRLAGENKVPFQIFNVGNSQPVLIKDLVSIIEDALAKTAIIVDKPMQKGDMYKTFADTGKLNRFTDYTPSLDITAGIVKTVEWYTTYFNKRTTILSL